MNRLFPGKLPAFYEYYDVPFLVYTDTDGKPVAVSDLGIISSKLPEIVFEGEKIDENKFVQLAKSRTVSLGVGETYKDVLNFAKNL